MSAETGGPDGRVERTPPAARPIAKVLARTVCGVGAAPLVLGYRAAVRTFPDRRDQVFQAFSQFLSLWPGLPGDYLRIGFYRRTLARCSDDASIGFGTTFATPDVWIGRNVYIGIRCTIASAVIHDDVLVGSNVDILAGREQHRFDRVDVPIRRQGGTCRRISVGPDAWIGNGATITEDVGRQAVVAAAAVVLTPVQPRAIVGGNPARVLGWRGGSSGD